MDRRNLLSAAGRGFLAFVGGAAVSGAVQRASAATSPTLILPPGLVTAPAAWPDLMAGGHPPVHLRKFNSEMDAILHVKSGLDRAAYCLWLDVGLLMVHGGRRSA